MPVTLPLVYFVRHGQTAWNVEYRLQGQADTDIDATGRAQADRNGDRLAELIAAPQAFDFVSSPLKRTRETMERIRRRMGLDPHGYRTDTRLMELSFGDWEGFTFAELEARHQGSTEARNFDKWHFVPPGDKAESYQMLTDRFRPWLDEVKRPTVCVTHGGIIRAVFRLLADMAEDEAAALDIVQDKVLRLERGRLEWL